MELKVLFAMTNLHNARNNILTRRGLSKLPFVCWSPPWTQNCVASVRNKQYFDQRLLKVEVFSKRLNPCNKFFQSSFISLWILKWIQTVITFQLKVFTAPIKVSKNFVLIDFKGSLKMSSSDFGPIINTSSLPRPTMSVKYFNSSSIFQRCVSNPCAFLYPSREMTVFWCNPNPKYRQSPTGPQSIWDLLFS